MRTTRTPSDAALGSLVGKLTFKLGANAPRGAPLPRVGGAVGHALTLVGGQLRLSVATATAASAPNPPLVENAKRKEEARAAVEDVLARKEARRERSRSPSPPPQPRPFAAVAKTRFDELRTADDYAARALLREHGVANSRQS